MISGGRSKKLPLTGQPTPFAVQHRLTQDLLARAFAPLMVELFAVDRLGPTPDLIRDPIPPVTRLEAPHASAG